jgi:hypothetical protein
MTRLRRAGHQTVWVGTARVRHYIPAERLTKAYVREMHRQKGRTEAREKGPPECSYLWDAPRWAVRAYLAERLRSLLLTPLPGSRWVPSFLQAARLEGYIAEVRALRRRRAPADTAAGAEAAEPVQGPCESTVS